MSQIIFSRTIYSIKNKEILFYVYLYKPCAFHHLFSCHIGGSKVPFMVHYKLLQLLQIGLSVEVPSSCLHIRKYSHKHLSQTFFSIWLWRDDRCSKMYMKTESSRLCIWPLFKGIIYLTIFIYFLVHYDKCFFLPQSFC